MPLTDVAPIQASTEIAAPPAAVWAVVSDLRNMSRWSPQLVRSFLRGENGEGARFVNLNRKGALVWPTRSKVVRFVPDQEIAWRVRDNFTVWSLRLEPVEGGTRLIQTREAPDGISDISVGLTNRFLGGVPNFTAALQRDMATTLARIKAEVEAS